MKLARDGVVNLTISTVPRDMPRYRRCFFADIDRYRVCYDVNDAVGLTVPDTDANELTAAETDALLDRCDFVFKRSYSPTFAQALRNRGRYFPLGLFYRYFPKRNRRENSVMRKIAQIERILHGWSRTDQLAAETGNVDKYWTIGSAKRTDIDILFTTRLWDIASVKTKAPKTDASDREERNRERIDFLRALRRHSGRTIISGVSDSPIARQLCPDLILSDRYTARANYRNLLRRSKVCVTTTGLSKSIGGRFAEYISAGKAIVTTPLYFTVTGDLSEGKNYLTFTTADELIAQAEKLLSDGELRRDMELQNVLYYTHYVRPDVQVLNTIITVLEQGKFRDAANSGTPNTRS
ncbi:MAG: glycosyltransferase family 1 protein [Thermoguttaceae bacterium]|nr:glycosyltransferase family 1 protein [Thermoguttaceae bacterium]